MSILGKNKKNIFLISYQDKHFAYVFDTLLMLDPELLSAYVTQNSSFVITKLTQFTLESCLGVATCTLLVPVNILVGQEL